MECIRCHSQLIEHAAYCPHCGEHQPDAPVYDDYAYAAFISYRHRHPDTDVAERLHRAIETYRLPKGITTIDGKSAIGRIFRDKEELSATASLPDSIRTALEQSSALVVICSHETPNSRWVQQEVELFASFHGRDRVFAVLADGQSSESLPEILRFRTETLLDGTLARVPAEPLAADMRSNNRQRLQQETARVVAGIIGCAYDDLVQRVQTRRKRWITAIAATCAAVVIAGTALGAFALGQRWAALTQESQRLAAESQQLLEQGDRYGAIETALSALPSSQGDISRPLVEEAQAALEQALEIGKRNSPWRSGFSIETVRGLQAIDSASYGDQVDDAAPFDVSAIVTSISGNFLAVSDNTAEIAVYDLTTGVHLVTCTMPASEGQIDSSHHVMLEAVGNHLIVSDPPQNTIACFGIPSGNRVWAHTTRIAAMYSHENIKGIAAAALLKNGGVSVNLFNIESGKGAVVAGKNNAGIPLFKRPPRCVLGDQASDFYLAVNNKLAYIDILTNKYKSVDLEYEYLTDLSSNNKGIIIACTEEQAGSDSLNSNYCIEAFDTKLHKLWKHKGSTQPELSYGSSSNVESTVIGRAVVRGFLPLSGDAVVSTGREVHILNSSTGKERCRHSFGSTVLDAEPWGTSESKSEKVFIATADGTILLKSPDNTEDSFENDKYRHQLGFPLRWSSISLHDNMFTWLSVPAGSDNRIVAFHTDLTYGEEPDHDYSLDELIALAHETLENR